MVCFEGRLGRAFTPPETFAMQRYGAKKVRPTLSVLRERIALWLWRRGWLSRPL